ncbi:MAG: V-type ATPase subunit [Anaerolineae bacterium]
MSDYGYANARLRAMRSRLFDNRAYDDMLGLTRIDDVIAWLDQSTWADDIEAALARYMGLRVVMEAARLNLTRTYARIRSFLEGEASRLLDVLLARWDLANLKVILRSQRAGVAPDTILEMLTPAGALDEAALRLLARQPDAEAMVNALRLWDAAYAGIVRDAVQEAGAREDPAALDYCLDRSFYKGLLAALRPDHENDDLVRQALAREIDSANVAAALRLRAAGASVAEEGARGFFLPGGSLSVQWLAALTHVERDEAVLAWLRETPLWEAVAHVERLDVVVVQSALDRACAAYQVGFFRRSGLSIAPVIAYIAAKNAEAANVRLIAQAVALGVARSRVEPDLVLV